MNRKELIDVLSEKTGMPKKAADEFLRAFTETVVGELKNGGSVALVGFGTFKTAERQARKAKNPRTGEEITIPARRVPVFKFSKNLKEI